MKATPMEIQSKYKIRTNIWIEWDMFYSEAFRCLSASAIKTLMRCFQKRKWEKKKVHGKKQIVYIDDGFTFPYTEAAALGIAGDTQHWKNMKKLVEVGFLEVVHQGGWYQKHEREKDYSVYKHSERWRKYGTSEFVMVEKPKVLPKNFHIRENMGRQKLKVTSQKRSEQLHENEDDGTISENIRLHESEVEERMMESRQSFTAIA
jgi:hypothetical protein